MAGRENEADRRPVAAPAGSQTIAPSDSAVLSPICHKLWIHAEAASGKTVKLRLLDGSTPTLTVGLGPTVLDVQFDMVFTTGTNLTTNPVGFFPLS